MKNRSFSYLSAFVVFILSVGMACGASPVPTPTSTSVPTSTLAPTKTPAPTNTAAPTSTPTSEPALFTISKDLYEHPSGVFSLYPPQGWEVTDSNYDASFIEPNGNGQVLITATNTGYELDPDSFTKFVNATESNLYARFIGGNYNELSNEHDPASNTIQVYKTLTLDGKPWVVDTIYYQVSQAIVAVHFFMTSDTHLEAYFKLLENISIDGGAVGGTVPYVFTYTHMDTNSLFQFDVPTAWEYTFVEESSCYVDRFESPDTLAAIENITCNTGQPMNQSAAGQFALELLNSAYTSGAGDIRISKDEPQADGSEKLTWSSKQGGYSGVSFFETRDTNLLLLTMFASDAAFAVFTPTFDNVTATYKVP